MAWRLHEHVLRGKIDNRTRGQVSGEIWLAGIDEPMVLELTGDCAPDLAGCELSFQNPDPIPMATKPPAPHQRGPAGDMTGARKVRVFDVPIDEAIAMFRRGETPPEHMANAVYRNGSQRSGRVVIESADYRLQISESAWRYSKEEIAKRDRRIGEKETPFADAITRDGETQEWDEVRYEQFLRESVAARAAPAMGLWMARVPRQSFGSITGRDLFARAPGQPEDTVSPVESAAHDVTLRGEQVAELARRSNRVLTGTLLGRRGGADGVVVVRDRAG